jgi:hypothetical protein
MSLEVGTCFRNLANEGQNFPTKIICTVCVKMILLSLKKKCKNFGLNPENIWRFFLNIGRIMAIEVLKNHLILAL